MSRQPQFPCPTCGGYARIAVDAGKQIACARCGTVVTALPFGAARSSSRMPHSTPIRVGMKALIGGREFWAVGRIQYVQKDEDSISRWEEWVLLSPDGEARYLEYDEGKWTMTEPFTPTDAPSFEELSAYGKAGITSARIDGSVVTVSEAADCQVEAVEGEIPWPVMPRDRVRYVDFGTSMGGGGTFYSAELDEENREVEWFRGRRLDDRAVFTLFDLRHLLAALERRSQVGRERRLFAVACLLAGLLAFLGWGFASGQGRMIASDTAPVSSIPEEGKRFGPFSLQKVGRVYRLRVSSNVTQSSVWVQGVVEDQEGAMFDVESEFWDEYGSDSDGPWHESSLNAQADFRLDRPTNVYVRLFADPEATATGAIVSFRLEEGVLYPVYLAVFGFLSTALSVCFFIASSPSVGAKVWQGVRAQ